MKKTLQRRTVGEELADRLRDRILRGELRPGDTLPELSIAERYETSRPSVRAALRQLAHEGLVEHETHRGARVAELGADELRDISEVRLVIEPAILRRSTFTEAELEELRACAARLEEAAETGDWSTYAEADLAFHTTLVRAAAGRRLARFHAVAVRQLRLHFTSIDLDDKRPAFERGHVPEHRRIVELLAAGRRADAARLLTKHLEDAREALL